MIPILDCNFYDFEDVSVKCLFWDDRKVRKVLILLGILGFLIVENLIGEMVFWANSYLIILEILGKFEKS